MNRLLVVAFAAALSQFALACTTERTEIYEPAEQNDTSTEKAEKIDTAKISDTPDVNFPIAASADLPIDKNAAQTTPVDITATHVQNGAFLPPVVDVNRIDQIIDANGNITAPIANPIDPASINDTKINPLYQLDPLPTFQDAQTQPDGLGPYDK